MNTPRVLGIIFVAELLGASSHVFFRTVSRRLASPSVRDPAGVLRFAGAALAQPLVWAGLATATLAIAVWLAALNEAPLSVAYPMASMQFLVTLVASRIFLGERITRRKVIATGLIVTGIYLVTLR